MSRMWLIDAGYLFQAQKTVEPSGAFRFDYLKLRNLVAGSGSLARAIMLNSEPADAALEQKNFHSWLQKPTPEGPGFEVKIYGVKSRNYKCPNCQSRFPIQTQQGVDVGLATLALTLASEYDTLILSSGDGDYRDALEYVCTKLNKRLELAVFRSGVSQSLQALSSSTMWFEDHKEEIRKT